MPTTECLPQLTLGFHPDRDVVVSFDAPQASSDGGWLLLRSADDRSNTTRSMAALLPQQPSEGNVVHSTHDVLMQRMFQIAAGYEDANDASRLRFDPLLRVVAGRTTDDAPLASQPTISRLENRVTLRDIVRLTHEHERRYVASLPEDLEVLVLDIDGTDDPTHGQQVLAFFNGHYNTTMLAPLLVFDQNGRLASVRLRSGKQVCAQHAAPMLERLIRRVRARFPELPILVRADSAFATTAIINRLDRLGDEVGNIEYVIGVSNKALQRGAQPTMALAEEEARARSRTARFYNELIYQSEDWDRAHRVVVKAEHNGTKAIPRFVVTTLTAVSASQLYERIYCGRGSAESHIDEFKNGLAMDRLSCHRFEANAFRLLMHAAAYELMHAVRSEAMRAFEHGAAADGPEHPAPSSTTLITDDQPRLARWKLATLRVRLLKVAALVRTTVRRIWVALPASFPFASLFAETALRLGARGTS